jgi:hypothetical protein
MHLIITIALGVFGGLWLFVKWAEWRENRAERREIKMMAREAKRQERERATAEHEAKLAHEAAARARQAAVRARFKPPRMPMDWEPWAMTAYAIGALAAIPVGYLMLGGH